MTIESGAGNGLGNGEAVDYKTLKAGGFMRQTESGLFAMRLHVIGGHLTAAQFARVAEVSTRYGRGDVHLTARQGVEIPYVPLESLKDAQTELEAAGLSMGACGPRVRTVTACQGASVCRHGVVETAASAQSVDERYYGEQMPHKFKFTLTGCTNNCMKVQENDIGLMGVIEPEWNDDACDRCGICVAVCRSASLSESDDGIEIDRSDCNGCGDCVASCPTDAWKAGKRGFQVWVGGKMGRVPMFAKPLPGIVTEDAELFAVADSVISFYRRHGKPRERLGTTITRLGWERLVEEVANGE